jgi:hypothetical protein
MSSFFAHECRFNKERSCGSIRVRAGVRNVYGRKSVVSFMVECAVQLHCCLCSAPLAVMVEGHLAILGVHEQPLCGELGRWLQSQEEGVKEVEPGRPLVVVPKPVDGLMHVRQHMPNGPSPATPILNQLKRRPPGCLPITAMQSATELCHFVAPPHHSTRRQRQRSS